MWLPKPLYEALPWLLLLGGAVAAAAAWIIAKAWTAGWIATGLTAGGILVAIAGLVLLLKRRDYRMSRSRIRYDNLD